MANEPDNERPENAYELNLERYGNQKEIQDVFERPTHPAPTELVSALAATECLTEREATVFVYEIIERQPIDSDSPLSDDFERKSESESITETARGKVADAIWISELIDAYRFPDFPEECRECGNKLGGTCVGRPNEGKSGVLCHDCADIDLEINK